MRIFMVFIMIPCYLLMAFMMSLAAKPHNHVVLENTLPLDKLKHPDVLALTMHYRKRQFQLAGILSLFSLVLLVPMKDSIFMTLFFLLIFMVSLSFFLQIRYIRRMRELIVKNEWQVVEVPIQVDTQLIMNKNQRLVSIKWFLPSLLLCLLPVHFMRSGQLTWLFVLLSFGLQLLFLAIWYGISRLPVKALTDDQAINQQYNDLTKFHWSFLMLVISWLFPFLTLLPAWSLVLSASVFSMIAFVLFLLLLFFCAFTFYWLFRLRRKQDALLAQTSSFRYHGDDYYWRYGFYYNPDDRRLMVPDRIGFNLSVNLARVGGKIFLGITGVILVVTMFISIVPLYVLDFHPNPMTLQVSEHQVRLDGPYVGKKRIPLKKIQQVALLEQLPNSGTRTNGMATENYAVGSFRVKGKAATFLVDHRSTPILKIKTADRDYYYTNRDAKQTLTDYQRLKAKHN
ncbi:hypothetical protein NRIC_14210 [Enterococcus florum]|uniref:Bacterial Pleckstrin homology domain-containing protein n=1 Tax=Enterococcus florum TaxID=2480627 RepID=A0A4P5P6X8_9ENTE|nr:PH domain-containing protein [Enterococcus florum]GCF93530.1 hypothetical protein NRIC_14210 [Enterococcus florum]